MDYQSFEKAMERAGKALFVDNDTERCMKVMQSIINKFDPQRWCQEVKPSMPLRVACFCGAIRPIDAIAAHISMARLWAYTGEVRLLYTALQQLLVLSFYWRLRKPTSPALSLLPSADDQSIITSTSGLRCQLPAEIWREVVSWLSRPDWRTLFYVPHPLRRFAVDLFFREIFLQFDVYGYHPGDARLNSDLEELEAWHSQRSLDIMTRILRDAGFASRVRTLKVSMCDHRLGGPIDVIELYIVCLGEALRRMTGLNDLHLYGSPIFLHNLVSHLPQLSPRLQGVTVKYHMYGGQVYFPRIPTLWAHLVKLCIYPSTTDVSSYNDGLQQISQHLRRLKMAHRSSLTPLIDSLAGNLTHLELIAPWGAADETSLFQVVLGHCDRLESLRLIGCPQQSHSVYFRQYSRSLPQLRDFAVRLAPGLSMVMDPDFFRAICDFLQDRPILESLELVPFAQESDQAAFGFDERVWVFLSSLQHIRILSTVMLNAIPHQRMVELIPRSVKTLTVSVCDWYLEQLLELDGWPDDLCFFGFNEHLHQDATSLAKRIASSVPSIRVVRVADDYFSVAGREDGKRARLDQWSSRATKIFRKEYLESHGCEDYEYLYVDHDGVLP